MKLKLDENLGVRGAEILRDRGHDVSTAADEDLCGASDPEVIGECRAEGRCLVTLDLDFGNPMVFTPSDYDGIAVLRLPRRPSANDLLALVETLAAGLAALKITGKLWIVQRNLIREYQPEDRKT